MDYYLPPPIEDAPIVMAQASSNVLTLQVEEAAYDQNNKSAEIKLIEALQKSHQIESYNGKFIRLTHGSGVNNSGHCPDVKVKISDIKREINYINNEVVLTISNLPDNVAQGIESAQCLMIDTVTVKKVSNPDFKTVEEKLGQLNE